MSMFLYLHVCGVEIARIEGRGWVVLVDNASFAMELLQAVNGQRGGPLAIKTKFGWILSGAEDVSSSGVCLVRASSHCLNQHKITVYLMLS